MSLILNRLFFLLLIVLIGADTLISDHFLLLLLLLLPFLVFGLLFPSCIGHVLLYFVFDRSHLLAECAFFVLAPFPHLQKLVLGLFEWLFADLLQFLFGWVEARLVDGTGVTEVNLF